MFGEESWIIQLHPRSTGAGHEQRGKKKRRYRKVAVSWAMKLESKRQTRAAKPSPPNQKRATRGRAMTRLPPRGDHTEARDLSDKDPMLTKKARFLIL